MRIFAHGTQFLKNDSANIAHCMPFLSFAYETARMQQLNKVSTLEVVQLVRDSVHTICDVYERKLDG